MKNAEETVEKEAKQGKTEYTSKIVAQLTHFFKEKPNTLQVEQELPFMSDSGYPKNGIIKVRLKKEDGNMAFNLNCAEALELSEVLKMLAQEHLHIVKSLWRQK